MSEFFEPRVFLVGAGSGDPGLLTVRAVEILSQADLVLYDQLVPRRLLDFTRPGAELVCVRDLPGRHPDKYPHIQEKLISAARAGKIVVRLKGGDPLIFGRGGEEAEALRQAGIAYEIVPGVTAALAAAAYLDIPISHRVYSSAVALVTGHEVPGKPGNRLDWSALAKFPGTLAVYMGVARLPLIIQELVQHGKDPETPALIVERASTGDMRSVSAPLKDLEQARRGAGLEAPGLIIIGSVVSLRHEKSWFERRPLFGKRILVTRPAHQADPLLRKLELLGAVPFLLPVIEIRDPADFTPVDTAIRSLAAGEWDWLVFTSSNGVHKFMDRLDALGLDLRILGSVKLAAIGPKTADALRSFRLNPDIVPTTYDSEGLADSLRVATAGKCVLLARANRGRDLLREELTKTAAKLEQVTVYEQVDLTEPDEDVLNSLRRGEIGIVMLTSSNIARGVLGGFDDTIRGRIERGEIRLVVISPQTAKTVRELGYPVAIEAKIYTVDGMIDAIIHAATDDHCH